MLTKSLFVKGEHCWASLWFRRGQHKADVPQAGRRKAVNIKTRIKRNKAEKQSRTALKNRQTMSLWGYLIGLGCEINRLAPPSKVKIFLNLQNGTQENFYEQNNVLNFLLKVKLQRNLKKGATLYLSTYFLYGILLTKTKDNFILARTRSTAKSQAVCILFSIGRFNSAN